VATPFMHLHGDGVERRGSVADHVVGDGLQQFFLELLIGEPRLPALTSNVVANRGDTFDVVDFLIRVESSFATRSTVAGQR
jgi:hypothetical protein